MRINIPQLKAARQRKDLFGGNIELHPLLRDRFVVPPFSVLDTRQAYWQERKRQWISIGLQGELGRNAPISGAPLPLDRPSKVHLAPGGGGGGCWLGGTATASTAKYRKPQQGRCFSTDIMRGEAPKLRKGAQPSEVTGTSIFDPVLCEVVYRWFCPNGGTILDPFAGEGTKGIVAACLGLHYTGIELRAEQITANQQQAAQIGVAPTWIEGNSLRLHRLVPDNKRYDLIFTSPPYYDLEVYSNQEADISALGTYEDFMKRYYRIFAQCVNRLRRNRFLVVKVSEIRDRKTGAYRNFVGDNITLFRKLGLHYYNEAILINALGSLPIRAAASFRQNRKLGRTHQNILVFFKGDPKEIRNVYPDLS